MNLKETDRIVCYSSYVEKCVQKNCIPSENCISLKLEREKKDTNKKQAKHLLAFHEISKSTIQTMHMRFCFHFVNLLVSTYSFFSQFPIRKSREYLFANQTEKHPISF